MDIKDIICDSELTIDGKVDLIMESCLKEHDRELKEALEKQIGLYSIDQYDVDSRDIEIFHEEWNQFWKERGV